MSEIAQRGGAQAAVASADRRPLTGGTHLSARKINEKLNLRARNRGLERAPRESGEGRASGDSQVSGEALPTHIGQSNLLSYLPEGRPGKMAGGDGAGGEGRPEGFGRCVKCNPGAEGLRLEGSARSGDERRWPAAKKATARLGSPGATALR